MSSPAAGWAFNDYRVETNKGKRETKSPTPQAVGWSVGYALISQ
jgi:hypothetical protein